LVETQKLAAGAWSKSIIGRVNSRGTFASCNKPGTYLIAIDDSTTVPDFPKVNGVPIYSYGMMIVTVGDPCISQLYISHRGHVAVRQSWNSGEEYQEWFVQYSSANKPSAADIGAFSSSGGKVSGIIHADNWIMGKELWERDPNSGKEERAYSPFNKPSASDIGAIANHELAFLGNGGKFQDCLLSGFYKVGIADIATVADAPTRFYGYGILEVQNSNGVVSQRYISHTGQVAVRQSWSDGGEWLGWNVVYSSTFKPTAADVGAFPITGGKVNGDIGTKGKLILGETDNSLLKIYSHNTAHSPIYLYTFGDLHTGGSRHAILEAADDKGWLWYSTRLTSDQIEFKVNGKIIPNDYSNFDARYVQDIRFGSVEHSAIWKGYGFSDTPPYVITAIVNDGNNEPDTTSRRPLQKLINGTWYNIGAL
ncbi:hypothetical protein AB204_16420, partial [Xenorhabdus khoisanae]